MLQIEVMNSNSIIKISDRNIPSKESKECLNSTTIKKYSVDVDIELDWGVFLNVVMESLGESQNTFFSVNADVLRITPLSTIGDEYKSKFVMLVLKKLKQINEEGSSMEFKAEVENGDIPLFFSDLFRLMKAIVHAHNISIDRGEYGVVANDVGMAMWSTRPPIK